jgi:hypothetical protein
VRAVARHREAAAGPAQSIRFRQDGGLLDHGCPPVYAENLLIGCDHGKAGADIAAHWKLPSQACGGHPLPPSAGSHGFPDGALALFGRVAPGSPGRLAVRASSRSLDGQHGRHRAQPRSLAQRTLAAGAGCLRVSGAGARPPAGRLCYICWGTMRTIPGWDQYYLDICQVVSCRSKDPNTQIGCVIVGPNHEIRSTGYNSSGSCERNPRNAERRTSATQAAPPAPP